MNNCFFPQLTLLKSRTFNRQKLLKNGFVSDDGVNFIKNFIQDLADFNLSLKLVVSLKDNSLIPQVTDLQTDEPYPVFLLPQATGAFVGKIRSITSARIDETINNCTQKSRLRLAQSLEILSLCKNVYHTKAEYPWDDLQAAVLRNTDTGKWYALIISVSTDKLGLKRKPVPAVNTEILLLHHNKEDVARLVDGINFIPAWHMNKQSWLACIMDGRLDTKIIMEHVAQSFALSQNKKTVRKRRS